ncbi:2-hydroxyacid dehydrogenase [Caldanaerobius polysaccharolyticus]|uniref:2-hydroxyacid dehydrogenase n=1 Tax=Caldanaerobius polysaccharolyticus TaxID=44256 RepID=UPI000556C0CA|nr:D-glycerate dehydrogenase [Caldanaerobius polysaccharolyticus]
MLPPAAMEFLEQHFNVEVNPEDRPLTREEILEKVKGRDAVLTQLVDKVDAELLDAAKGVKIIANYAVGYDNIDVDAATQRGVMISNTPDVLTDATAELAWALLFAAARRIVEADKYFRAGKYKSWSPMLLLGQGVSGKTLGVIGAGRIGTAFAVKAKGFNMRILYADEKPNPRFEEQTGGQYVDKETLLRESDFVSIHCPLLPSTRHLIGDKEFDLMKKTAVLINTARGPIVDEKALVRALKEGKIFAAGLDVYENEPAAEPELYEMDNVVLLPHIGSATTKSREDMGILAASNILDAYEGRVPRTLVNREVLNKLGK